MPPAAVGAAAGATTHYPPPPPPRSTRPAAPTPTSWPPAWCSPSWRARRPRSWPCPTRWGGGAMGSRAGAWVGAEQCTGQQRGGASQDRWLPQVLRWVWRRCLADVMGAAAAAAAAVAHPGAGAGGGAGAGAVWQHIGRLVTQAWWWGGDGAGSAQGGGCRGGAGGVAGQGAAATPVAEQRRAGWRLWWQRRQLAVQGLHVSMTWNCDPLLLVQPGGGCCRSGRGCLSMTWNCDPELARVCLPV